MSRVIGIGGIGGSGTRAVAQVLLDLQIYMGDDLNPSNDNLLFTRLFNDPKWYERASRLELIKRLSIFEEYMRNDKVSPLNLIKIFNASKIKIFDFRTRSFYSRSLLKTTSKRESRDIWGWKEPNTQMYIEELSEYIPDFKYIHVIRNGLDLAFSSNKIQLSKWGSKFGVFLNKEETNEELSIKQIDYWIESTKYVLRKAKNLGNNFLLINYSELCLNTEVAVAKIIEFTELPVSDEKFKRLTSTINTPDSFNCYKHKDLSIFSDKQISFVKEMGFEV